jgi:hypothetical protein
MMPFVDLFRKGITKKTLLLIFITLSVLLGSTIVYAAQFYRGPGSNAGSPAINIVEHGDNVCVRNNNYPDIFIPTNTSVEWGSFKSAAPHISVLLGPCPGGGCLYAAAEDGIGHGNIPNGGDLRWVKQSVKDQINAWNTDQGRKDTAIYIADYIARFDAGQDVSTFHQGTYGGFIWKTIIEKYYDNQAQTNNEVRAYSLEIYDPNTCG